MISTYIAKLIVNAHVNKKLVSICLNKIHWNSRLIGYVINVSSVNKFKFQSFDEFGQMQKSRTISFESVQSLEIGGTYNDNLEKLIENRFTKKRSYGKYYHSKKGPLNLRIAELKASKTISTFFFGTEFCMGKVHDFTPEELFIKNIGFDGKKDGISVFKISQLTKIRCDSRFEKRISILTKATKEKDAN